jgi:hypothetical protein
MTFISFVGITLLVCASLLCHLVHYGTIAGDQVAVIVFPWALAFLAAKATMASNPGYPLGPLLNYHPKRSPGHLPTARPVYY